LSGAERLLSVSAEPFDGVDQVMYERLEQALSDFGEVMIRLDSGEEAELHLHNVEFVGEPFVKVDADNETIWFNAEKVESYWIHEDF
jgi:hypothetical protein